MEKPEWTKTIGFRLPHRTLDQLDELIENGLIRNRTDGVMLAVERLYNSEKYADMELEAFDLVLRLVAENPELYEILKNMKNDVRKSTE